jgi:hypothetical protein
VDFDLSSIILSIVVSGIGFVFFSYGRKMSRAPHVIAGVLLMGFPYFVSNVWLVLLITAALIGALYAAVRLGW